MCREMVPDQDDISAVNEMLQFFQKGDQTFRVEAVRVGSGKQA